MPKQYGSDVGNLKCATVDFCSFQRAIFSLYISLSDMYTRHAPPKRVAGVSWMRHCFQNKPLLHNAHVHRPHNHARAEPAERTQNFQHPSEVPDAVERKWPVCGRDRVQLPERVQGGTRPRVRFGRLLSAGDENSDALQPWPRSDGDHEVRRRRVQSHRRLVELRVGIRGGLFVMILSVLIKFFTIVFWNLWHLRFWLVILLFD